jgi:hypothetical protein
VQSIQIGATSVVIAIGPTDPPNGGSRVRQAPMTCHRVITEHKHGALRPVGVAPLLLTVSDPDQAAKNLITLAIDGGGPDNITCIVADIVEPKGPDPAQT